MSSYQWIQAIKRFYQRYWFSLVFSVVVTIAVVMVWQQLLPEAQLTRADSPTTVLIEGLMAVWALSLVVWLSQRAAYYAQRARTIHQQLLEEIAQRQSVETTLRDSKERLKFALEASGEGWWDWHIATGKVYRSPQYLKLLGYEVGEFPEEHEAWKNSIHPDDFSQVMQQISLHLQDGSVLYSYDYRVRTKSGDWQWISDCGKVVDWDAQNQPLRMIGTFKNIGDRKLAEDALRQSESTLRSFFNSGAMLMGIVELHGDDILHLSDNRTSANFFDTTPENMQNRFASEMGIPRAYIDQWLTFYRKAEQTQVPVRFEYPHNTASGQRWLAASICQISIHANQRPRFSYIAEDITDRKRVETELRNMTKVMAHAVSGISRLDIQGQYISVNKAYASTVGYQPDEMIGMFWQQTVHPDELERMITAYQQMVRDGRVEVETRGIRKDGSIFYKQLVMIASYNEHHQFLEHYCFMKDISDRKQAELALEKELLRSKTIFNTSIDGVVVSNHQGDIVQASPSFARMIGYTLEETLTLNIADLDTQWTREELRVMRETNQILPLFETRHRRKDGSQYDVEISYSRVELEGKIMHFCICRDISDRKRMEAERQQAEKALRESEATKQAIIQAIPDLLIRMQSDGEYIEFVANTTFNIVNPEQHRHDANVHNTLPSHLARQRLHHIQQALQSHTIQVYDQEIVITGKQCYEEVRIVPLLQDEVLVMVRDITDRKQAEEDLRHQKEMFQAIVDHIPVMITLFNAQGELEFINPELERALGWSLDMWQQYDILSKCYPNPIDRQNELEHMLAATGDWRDTTTLNASGQPLEISWANVRLSNGRLLGIGQDVSDRKRKELALRRSMEAAEAANLAKSTFLANMSHELRTPLNVILGFAQLMAHDPSLTPSQKEDLQTIRRSGDHLLKLINDVLDLSKIEAGYYTLKETGFDLFALLQMLRSMMAERVNSKRLQLEFNIAPEVPQFVIADDQKLRQILLNLLSNAIKFTSQGGITLRVRAKAWEQSDRDAEDHELADHSVTSLRSEVGASSSPITLTFEVTDTGAGIALNERDSIFDAFVQAEAGKELSSGTGLGLTISRKLLELMQGTISVDSTPNLGSTFTVTLPVRLSSSISSQPEQDDRLFVGLAPGQPQRRILVVDDQPENRTLLVRLLTQIGLDVQATDNGQDALQIWLTWQPDLTLMDIRMVEMDGCEVTRQIRAVEQGQASIIIALTAQVSESDRTAALAAGCNDYLSKPFQENVLFLKLREYLGLEFLYAEHKPSNKSVLTSSLSSEAWLDEIRPTMIASLPEGWLDQIETAAVRGNDQTIVTLLTQLPSECAQLSAYLKELAETYQFEQILHLLQSNLSP